MTVIHMVVIRLTVPGETGRSAQKGILPEVVIEPEVAASTSPNTP
jgi:hypothetical protein